MSVFGVFLVCIFPAFGLNTDQKNSEYRHFLGSDIALKWINNLALHFTNFFPAGISAFGVSIVNFEHISHLFLVFLLLTLNMQLPAEIFLDNKERKMLVKDKRVVIYCAILISSFHIFKYLFPTYNHLQSCF